MCIVHNMQKRCRLCLANNGDNLSIFDSEFKEEKIPLSLKIMVCISLTITPGDSLPKLICTRCRKLVNRFYEFRQICMNTHMKLMQYSNSKEDLQTSSSSETPEELHETTANEDVLDDDDDDDDEQQTDIGQDISEESYVQELQLVDDSMQTVTVICGEFEEVNCEIKEDEEGNNEEVNEYEEDEGMVVQLTSSEDSYDLPEEEVNSDIASENVNETLEEGCLMELEKLSETTYSLKPIKNKNARSDETEPTTLGLRQRYKCSGCIRVFSKLSSLDKHWDTCQQDQEVIENETQELDEEKSEQHVIDLIKKEAEISECTESGQGSPVRKRAQWGEGRKYPCPTCGKVFKVPAMLRSHERVHTGERPFLCSLCSRSFTQMYALRNHERQHRGESPYPCEQCGKGFFRPSDLEKHVRSHTGERPFMCSVCSKAFHQLSGLVVHERIHTGERPYSCTFCSMTFNQWANKQRHEKTHAGGTKPYSCDLCHRKFSERKEMELHRAGHGGGRPRNCQYCTKSFRKPSELRDHLRRIHTNERPYKCQLCPKAFFVAHELKQHLMVHTGERPFSCRYCTRTFTQRGNLKRHFERHHRDEAVDQGEATLIVEEVDMDDMKLTVIEATD